MKVIVPSGRDADEAARREALEAASGLAGLAASGSPCRPGCSPPAQALRRPQSRSKGEQQAAAAGSAAADRGQIGSSRRL